MNQDTYVLSLSRPRWWADERLVFVLLAALLSALLVFGPRQAMTGDEPRYLFYSVSIFRHGAFGMSLSEWEPFSFAANGIHAAALPVVNGTLLINSVYLSTLLSPIGAAFGLAGLRLVTLVVGIVGLFSLLRLCRQFASPEASLLAVGTASFTIPLLPYLHLFLMETFLFAGVSIAWLFLHRAKRSARSDWLLGILILALPFVHMRGSVVAAILYMMLLWRVYQAHQFQRAVGLVLLGAVAVAALASINLFVYGAIIGPVHPGNTARPPSASEWFSILSMQLFNVRHGLIAYAPIWLLGYAGLCAGSIRGSLIAREGLLLAFIATVTGVGINAGECWPARFWVLSIPMLTVGLCQFWEMAKPLTARLIALALLSLTLINTIIFLQTPNAFLENRQTTTTYQTLYDATGLLNLGLILPVESGDLPNRLAAGTMTIGAAIFIGFMILALLHRSTISAVIAAVLLMVPFDIARVQPVPRSDYNLSTDSTHLHIAFTKPLLAVYVQFGRRYELWFVPPWPRFLVSVTGADPHPNQDTIAANQVLAACCWISGMSVEESGGSVDLDEEARSSLAIYRSNSIIRRLLSSL
jgi:hypothetical protein